MKFKYPAYLVEMLEKEFADCKPLPDDSPLRNQAFIKKLKAKDLVDSPNIASWEK